MDQINHINQRDGKLHLNQRPHLMTLNVQNETNQTG